MQRTHIAVALVVLVLLAGCGGAGSDGGSAPDVGGEQTASNPAADGSSGGADVESGDDGSAPEARAQAQTRYRVRTAHIVLEVASYDAARSSVVDEARRLGGYVEGETADRHTRGNETWTTGSLVVRVPAERYDEFVTTVESSGTVEHRESNVRDVTEQVVDLRARLANLRAQRDRLRTLYESANDTETVLRVEDRLSTVQGEIERVEGRLQVLEHQVAYSTVRVQLQEEPPTGPFGESRPAWYETGVFAAFLESVDGVVVLGRMLVVGVAYALPYALAVGLPVAGLYGVARRVR